MNTSRARALSLLVSVVGAVAACGGAPPSPAAAGTTAAPLSGSAATPETAPVYCDLVCERALVAPRPNDDPDYHAMATENANQVLTSIHPRMLACYTKRIAVNPAAHGFITIDIVVGPDGHVITVETTGGAILGPATMSCMTHEIERAVFAPPHGGGTLRIHVPFSLRRVAAGEEA
jgi:hypothetical protein